MEYDIKKLKKVIKNSSEKRKFWKKECNVEFHRLIAKDWEELKNKNKTMSDTEKKRLKELYLIFGSTPDKDDVTVLCSIRAHLRGKLHMTRCWSNSSWVDGMYIHNKIINWTMTDQAKLVEKYLWNYKFE
jgi:hypothetical protein